VIEQATGRGRVGGHHPGRRHRNAADAHTLLKSGSPVGNLVLDNQNRSSTDEKDITLV